MKVIDKEKQNLEKIMAVRNIIFSTLKANIIFSLIKKAKNVPGMEFKHLNYMTEKIADELSKKSLGESLKDSIDIVEMKITNIDKIQELIDEIANIEFLKNLLIDYEKNKIKYDAEKFQEGHELLFGDTEVKKL